MRDAKHITSRVKFLRWWRPGRKVVGAASVAVALVAAWVGYGAYTLASSNAAATPAPLSVTVVVTGTSTAAWTDSNTVQMVAGSTAGDSAEIDVVHPPAAAPASVPSFNVLPAAVGGDPRWVIEFHNGQILDGSGPGDGNGWSCPLGNANSTTYAAALAACQAGGLDDTVTAAFIVDDAGEAGKTFEVSDIQYNGQTAVTIATLSLRYVCGGSTKTWSTKVSEPNDGTLPASATYYGYKGSAPTKLSTYTLKPGTYPDYRTHGYNGLGVRYAVSVGPTFEDFWVHITAPKAVTAC